MEDKRKRLIDNAIALFINHGIISVTMDGTTSRKDVKNKDEKLWTRNLKDLMMLYDFTYHDHAWDGGQIYDPYSGKTYSCSLKLKDEKLYIRGYIGVSLFGRTSVWERAK